jgi:hypothetical protein
MVTGLLVSQLSTGSLVRTFCDHVKSEPEPPDHRPSSNVDFPVAWITGPATDPSLKLQIYLTAFFDLILKTKKSKAQKDLEAFFFKT